jgi:hypothetical protein
MPTVAALPVTISAVTISTVLAFPAVAVTVRAMPRRGGGRAAGGQAAGWGIACATAVHYLAKTRARDKPDRCERN